MRKSPDLDLMPSVLKMCPDVKIATYALPGSDELGKNIGKCFREGCDIVLLENHGVCIGTKDMFTAFQRFETWDYAANLEILAKRVGTSKPLDAAAYQVNQIRTHLKMDDFILGSHSVRLSDGSFLIAPFGMDRIDLEEDNLVCVEAGMKEM